MVALMIIRGFPPALPEGEIKGLLETIGQVTGSIKPSSIHLLLCFTVVQVEREGL